MQKKYAVVLNVHIRDWCLSESVFNISGYEQLPSNDPDRLLTVGQIYLT